MGKKCITLILTFTVTIVGLFPASVEAKWGNHVSTYLFGGEYYFRNKKLDEEYKLIMNEFCPPEGKTVGYIDIIWRFCNEGTPYLSAGVKRWALKKTGKNRYKSRKLKIAVYKKKVTISGKYAKTYGFNGTYKLKKRYIS